MPYCLILFLIFLLWFTYERKKASRGVGEKSEAFWEKERQANFTTGKSIDDVPFFELPEEIVPTYEPGMSRELDEACQNLMRLTGHRLADLSRYTNTELRLKYGVGHFEELSRADESCLELIRLLNKSVPLLLEEGFHDEARALVVFAREHDLDSSSCNAALPEIGLPSAEHKIT